MVHRPAFPPQQRGEAPVAVVPVTDSQALEHIPQLYLFPFGSDAPPVPVVTRAADAPAARARRHRPVRTSRATCTATAAAAAVRRLPRESSRPPGSGERQPP